MSVKNLENATGKLNHAIARLESAISQRGGTNQSNVDELNQELKKAKEAEIILNTKLESISGQLDKTINRISSLLGEQ